MVRIALTRYLVIIKLCDIDQYQKCSSQRNFAGKLSQSVLEAEDFPFFMDICENNHDPRTIVKMAYCWIHSNILLNNYCFKRSDLLTNDKLSKKRTADFNLIWQVWVLTSYLSTAITMNVVIKPLKSLF